MPPLRLSLVLVPLGPLGPGLVAAGLLALASAACEKTDDAPPSVEPTEISDVPDPGSDAVARLDARLAAIEAEAARTPDAGAPEAGDDLGDLGAPGAPGAPEAGTKTASNAGPQENKKEVAEDNALRKRPRAFTPADLDTKELTALLAAHPRTKRLAKDVSYYWDPQAGIRVLGRGTNDPKGFEFEALPKIWDPDDGTGIKFLLVMGRSGENTSFIVVYRMSDESKATLASSFIMENEVGPLAFGFSQAVRRRVYFTSCWGCPGESGKVMLRDDGRVVIVQP